MRTLIEILSELITIILDLVSPLSETSDIKNAKARLENVICSDVSEDTKILARKKIEYIDRQVKFIEKNWTPRYDIKFDIEKLYKEIKDIENMK